MRYIYRTILLALIFLVSTPVLSAEPRQEKQSPEAPKTLSGHQSVVLSTAMAPDGRTAATGSNDRHIILWDVETGAEKLKIRAAGSGVTALAFSADGTTIASGSRDRDILFYDVKTGAETKRFPKHSAAVTSLSLHADGKHLVFGLDNGQAGAWNIETGKPVHPLNEHSRTITALATAPNRPWVAFASQDRTVSVWNFATGKPLTVFKEHSGAVESIAFEASGNRVVTGSTDRTAIIWNGADGKVLHRLEGHDGPVTFVAFAPDGATVYTASSDKTFIQWNAGTGKPLVRCSVGLPVTLAALSSDAFYTVATVGDSAACVFRTDSLRFTEPRQPPPVGKGPFARLFSADPPVLRLNPLQKPPPPRITLSDKTPQDPLSPAPLDNLAVFHPNKPCAATSGADRHGAVWNLEDGETLFRISCDTAFTSLAFRPQGNIFLAGARDGSLLAFNSTTGEQVFSARGHIRAVNGIAFTSDGTDVFTAGGDRNLVLWSVADGKSKGVFKGHDGPVNAVAVTPDRSRAISVSDDKTIRIWQLKSDTEDKSSVASEPQASPLISLALSPDGTWFAVGETGIPNNKEAASAISIWDRETFKPVGRIETPTAPRALAVSPDGRILASGGTDGVLVLWDAKTRQPFRAFPQIPRETMETMQAETQRRKAEGHWSRPRLDTVDFEPIRSVAFNTDGSRLLSSGGRDTLFWDVSKIVPPSIQAERAEQRKVSEEPKPDRLASLPVGKLARSWDEFPADVLDTALSRDGSRLSVALSSKPVLLFNADSGVEISRLTARTAFQKILFLPDGRTLLAGGEDGRFFAVNTITRKDNFSEKTHTDRITCLAVTPTGSKAVSGGDDRTAVIWDPKKGENLGRLTREHKGPIHGVAIHRDGSRILTASEDRKAILWDAKSLKPVTTVTDHRGPVHAVAFSADGSRYITASADKTAIVFQTATGKELVRLQGSEPFLQAEFDPSGGFLLTGDESGNTVLWNASDGEPIRRFPARFKPVQSVRFSANGRRVIVTDSKTVRIYESGIE